MEQTRTQSEVEAGLGAFPSLSDVKPAKRLDAIPGYKDYAEQVSRGIHGLVLKGGEPLRRIADLLHGTWLGHPLHSVLTDVTIGGWMFGSLMDLLSLTRRGAGARRGAGRLITIGTVRGVPTALSGLADFTSIPPGSPQAGS